MQPAACGRLHAPRATDTHRPTTTGPQHASCSTPRVPQAHEACIQAHSPRTRSASTGTALGTPNPAPPPLQTHPRAPCLSLTHVTRERRTTTLTRRVLKDSRRPPPGAAAGLGDSCQRGADNPHDLQLHSRGVFWRIRAVSRWCKPPRAQARAACVRRRAARAKSETPSPQFCTEQLFGIP